MSPEDNRDKQQQEKKGGGLLKIGCLLSVLMIAALVVVMVLWFKGMGVQTTLRAMEKVQGHAEVVEKLGKPLSLGSKDTPGKYSLPIHGSKGEGTLHVEVVGNDIKKLSVTVKATGEVIDIIGTSAEKSPAPKKQR